MIIAEELHNIKIDDFEALLDFLGDDILKNMLINKAETFPNKSKYYLGNNGKGVFWKGFRKEKIPQDRVRKFYIDEVYKNLSDLKLEKFFGYILKLKLLMIQDKEFPKNLNKLNEQVDLINNPELLLIINDMKIINVYSKLYGAVIDAKNLSNHEKDINIKSKIDEALANQKVEYEKIIEEKCLEYEGQIGKLNTKLEATTKKLEKKTAELDKKKENQKALEDKIPSLVEARVKEIFKGYASNEAMKLFNEQNIFDEDSALMALKTTIDETQKLVINKRYSSLENKIILEYLILKMIEAKKENI